MKLKRATRLGAAQKERRGRVRLERATRLGAARASDGDEGGWRSNR